MMSERLGNNLQENVRSGKSERTNHPNGLAQSSEMLLNRTIKIVAPQFYGMFWTL